MKDKEVLETLGEKGDILHETLEVWMETQLIPALKGKCSFVLSKMNMIALDMEKEEIV